MPKSKKNKQVDLSKTRKHGVDLKKRLIEEIRSCADNYSSIYIFSVNDMRNDKLKKVREQWRHSRFFIGKNKVMAIAFGRTPEEEYKPNLHKVGNHIKGQRGILFSNKSKEDVISWFNSYSEADFARSGSMATHDVSLKEGPLDQFPHSLEPYLRQLGLPTTLMKGVIHLVKDYEVCKAGDTLTPETAKILKLLGYQMAEFHIEVHSVWLNGCFEELRPASSIESESVNDNCVDLQSKMQGEEEEEEEEDDGEEIENQNDNTSSGISLTFKSPEEKSPIFRSLRNRTIKISRKK